MIRRQGYVVFRNEGPFTIQLYYPIINFSKTLGLYIKLETGLNVTKHGFSINILGFGIGLII